MARISLKIALDNVLIEEKCQNILNEELSISRDVIRATFELFQQINEIPSNSKWQEINGVKRIGFFFTPDFSNKVFSLENVSGFIYDFGTSENYQKNAELRSKIGGSYYSNSNTLYLTLPYFDGSIYIDDVVQIVSHELEHKYQNSLKETISYKGLAASGMLIMNNFPETTNEYGLGYALYYLSKQEIDAKCHQLAMELHRKHVTNMDEYTSTLMAKEKNMIKKFVDDLCKRPDVIDNCIKFLKCKPNDVLNYLNSQLGYLERKYRKVVALHFKTGYGEELVEGTKIRENIKFPTVNVD